MALQQPQSKSPVEIFDLDAFPTPAVAQSQNDVVDRIKFVIKNYADENSIVAVKLGHRVCRFLVKFDPLFRLRLSLQHDHDSQHATLNSVVGGNTNNSPASSARKNNVNNVNTIITTLNTNVRNAVPKNSVNNVQSRAKTVRRPPLEVTWKRDGSRKQIPYFEIEEVSPCCEAEVMNLVLRFLRVLGGASRSVAVLKNDSKVQCREDLLLGSKQKINTNTIQSDKKYILMPIRKFKLVSRHGEKDLNSIGFYTKQQVVDPETYKKHMSLLKSTSIDEFIIRLNDRKNMLEEAILRKLPVLCTMDGKAIFTLQKGDTKLTETKDDMSKLLMNLKWASGIFHESEKNNAMNNTNSNGKVNTIVNIIEYALKVDAFRCGELIWQLLPLKNNPVPISINAKKIDVSDHEVALKYIGNVETSLMYCDL